MASKKSQNGARKPKNPGEVDRRRKAHLAELVREGRTKRGSQAPKIHWAGDLKNYFLKEVFSKEIRKACYDYLFGPLVFPKPGRGSLELLWRPFPLLQESNPPPESPMELDQRWDEKATLAKYVLTGEHSLLDRNANILLGPGSHVFHIALELAHWLRQSIEEESDCVFKGSPFRGEIHTDSFDVARLLGPLAVRDSAPDVYLAHCRVSRKGQLPNSLMTAEPSKRAPGRINTLVMGCEAIDAQGSIFTGFPGRREVIESYLAGVRDTVIIVSTRDRLGRSGNKANLVQRVEATCKCEFYIVTNGKPKWLKAIPPGFTGVIWPGGQLPPKE